MEPQTNGENILEVSPFLPLETASQMSVDARRLLFWKWFQERFPLGHVERFNAREQACKAFDAHEMKVNRYILEREEQSLADWVRMAEDHRDGFLMPLRNRGLQFVCYYRSEIREYSPAEGGCFYTRRQMVACYPQSFFPSDNLEELKEYGRDKFGLVFEGDTIDEGGDWGSRKVRPLSSCAAEANAEVMLEDFPFASATMVVPHYE